MTRPGPTGASCLPPHGMAVGWRVGGCSKWEQGLPKVSIWAWGTGLDGTASPGLSQTSQGAPGCFCGKFRNACLPLRPEAWDGALLARVLRGLRDGKCFAGVAQPPGGGAGAYIQSCWRRCWRAFLAPVKNFSTREVLMGQLFMEGV